MLSTQFKALISAGTLAGKLAQAAGAGRGLHKSLTIKERSYDIIKMGNAKSRSSRSSRNRHATTAESREPQSEDTLVDIPRPLAAQAHIGIDDFELLKVVGKGR
jgi:hypothetical protein